MNTALAMIRSGCSYAEAEELTGIPWEQIRDAYLKDLEGKA